MRIAKPSLRRLLMGVASRGGASRDLAAKGSLTAGAIAAGFILTAAAAPPAQPDAAPSAAAAATTGAGDDDGLTRWAKIHQVLAHPRCVNCHVGADHVPMWSGPSYGPEPRPHGMNVNGGASRSGAESGMTCSTCHTQHNASLPHGPPGAHHWALAPVTMQWLGKTSAQICAQIKDPKRNGGRTLEQVAHHVENDDLVKWGWNPGPGREPAPFSSAELAQLLRAWARQGASCPQS